MIILPVWLPILLAICVHYAAVTAQQTPLLQDVGGCRDISPSLFAELEELARIVDISYCVGVTGLGIAQPFKCLSRCTEFPLFELVTTWNTGQLLSDSCGYIALDHGKQRVIVAFRGTYSIANTIMDLSTIPQEYVPYPGSGDGDDEDATPSRNSTDGNDRAAKEQNVIKDEPRCNNCTVHTGFHTSWLNTRKVVLPHLAELTSLYPSYRLHLVGHSLGGAVAALASLDFLSRGWNPVVTTFGEPRLGNANLVHYLDTRFNLGPTLPESGADLPYRRITHVNDPIPLLPLTEWGYAMHAGEIHIARPALSPDIRDVRLCAGDYDPTCIAGQDATQPATTSRPAGKRDLLGSVRNEIHDLVHEPWGIPSRYRLWELFFAHRDYFWRLGLCVPGGDPLGGGGEYARVS